MGTNNNKNANVTVELKKVANDYQVIINNDNAPAGKEIQTLTFNPNKPLADWDKLVIQFDTIEAAVIMKNGSGYKLCKRARALDVLGSIRDTDSNGKVEIVAESSESLFYGIVFSEGDGGILSAHKLYESDKNKSCFDVKLKSSPDGSHFVSIEKVGHLLGLEDATKIKLSKDDFAGGKVKYTILGASPVGPMVGFLIKLKDDKFELYRCDVDDGGITIGQQGDFMIIYPIYSRATLKLTDFNKDKYTRVTDKSEALKSVPSASTTSSLPSTDNIEQNIEKFVQLLIGEGKNPGRVGFSSKIDLQRQGDIKEQFKQRLAGILKIYVENPDFADFLSKTDNLAAKEQLASDIIREFYNSGKLNSYGKFKHVGKGYDIITRFMEAVSAVINRVFGDGNLYQDWSKSRTKFDVTNVKASANDISNAINEGFFARKLIFNGLFINIASNPQGNSRN